MRNLGDVAETVAKAHIAGHETFLYLGKTFHRYYYDDSGHVKGMCSMFVRLCFEAAAGVADHAYSAGNQLGNPVYFGGSALSTEGFLKASGKDIQGLIKCGHVICFNRNSGANGHIGIALGDGKFVENTVSTVRGPGTVVSRLNQMTNRISGIYDIGGIGEQLAMLKVHLLPDDRIIPCRPKVEDGVTRVDLRTLAEALGCEVHDHIADQGKIYIRRHES